MDWLEAGSFFFEFDKLYVFEIDFRDIRAWGKALLIMIDNKRLRKGWRGRGRRVCAVVEYACALS